SRGCAPAARSGYQSVAASLRSGAPAKSPFASVGREVSTKTVSEVATRCGPSARRRALSLPSAGGAAAVRANAMPSTATSTNAMLAIQRSALMGAVPRRLQTPPRSILDRPPSLFKSPSCALLQLPPRRNRLQRKRALVGEVAPVARAPDVAEVLE